MFRMFSIRLCSSGLSYVESKELTKAEPSQTCAGPRTPPDQTRPVTKARADTRDRSLMDAAAKDVKSTKTLHEPLKGHPGQKESISEPMRTRRSHNAELRKLSSSAEAGSVPAGTTPEVEKRTENILPPEKEHKEEVPQSPVKESPPPEAGPGQREDQLDAAVKPAVDGRDIVMEASGVLDPQKRKSPSETDREETPEKRPRLSSVSSVSSVSSASPSASSMSSPATPSSTSQRVSPLKVRTPNPQILWLLAVSKFSALVAKI